MLGAALAYEYRSLDGTSYLASDTRQFQGGLVAKRQYGASMLTASLAGGFAQSDVDRLVISGAVAKGDQDIGFVSAQVGASHAFERGDLYIKPRLDFSVDYISMNGFNEKGAGDLNLEVGGQDDFFYNMQAAVEFGGEIKFDNGVLLRPELIIGVTHYLGNKSPMVSAAFESSPSGVSPFTASIGLDQTYLDIGLGMDIISTDDWIISIDGFSRISDNTRTYGGGLKISIPFS